MNKSRKITAAENNDDKARIAALEAQIAALIADKQGEQPGFYDRGGDDYCEEKWERILDDEGGTVVFQIKADGYISCQPNLRFHNGKPIPGFGGKESRWLGADGKGGLRAYFRGPDFTSDIVAMVRLAKTVVERTGGKKKTTKTK